MQRKEPGADESAQVLTPLHQRFPPPTAGAALEELPTRFAHAARNSGVVSNCKLLHKARERERERKKKYIIINCPILASHSNGLT